MAAVDGLVTGKNLNSACCKEVSKHEVRKIYGNVY